MIGRVLVPIDGSELSVHALPYAAHVAAASRSALILMHAHLPVAMRKEAPYDLAPLADRLRSQGLEVDTVVRHAHRDETADVIRQTARDQGAGLIVMATHGRGGLGRWIYGSVADRVLRSTTVPVLLVPTAEDHAWPTDRPLRILVPLDGSSVAEEVIPSARALAITLRANVLLMRAVVPDIRPIFPDQGPGHPVVPRFDETNTRAYLWEAAEQFRDIPGTVDIRVCLGQPAAMIARTARLDEADLIAMTTRARGGFSRWALGSVATDTLRRARLPILLTRPTAIHHEEPIVGPLPEVVPAEALAADGATTVTLSPYEQEVLCEALELLMYSAHGDGSLTRSLQALIEKVRPGGRQAASASGRH